MDTEKLEVDRKLARELYRKYREHQHWSEPIDREIQRTYQLIAQGRMVIRAIDSIKKAGVDAHGLPKLAIVRADAKECLWEPADGGGEFMDQIEARRWRGRPSMRRIVIERGTWPGIKAQRYRYGAIVPLVPLHLRPKRGIENYHILWEAEWTRIVPIDPMLLRRIGQGDLWVVVGAWDLTEVERAALQARVSS